MAAIENRKTESRKVAASPRMILLCFFVCDLRFSWCWLWLWFIGIFFSRNASALCLLFVMVCIGHCDEWRWHDFKLITSVSISDYPAYFRWFKLDLNWKVYTKTLLMDKHEKAFFFLIQCSSPFSHGIFTRSPLSFISSTMPTALYKEIIAAQIPQKFYRNDAQQEHKPQADKTFVCCVWAKFRDFSRPLITITIHKRRESWVSIRYHAEA